ncbi:MAG: hypothetical protein IJF84_13745 [Thermoguttaceae bacterium]|nr:hypothetical protein [Thermoguttaceae bacterium]
MDKIQDVLQKVTRRKIREIEIDGQLCHIKYHVGSNRFMVNINGVPTMFTRTHLHALLLSQTKEGEAKTA